MESENYNSAGLSGLAWFAAGALIGIAGGLLLAPQSGKKTRRQLTREAKRQSNQLFESGQEIFDRGRDLFERGRALVEETSDLFERGH